LNLLIIESKLGQYGLRHGHRHIDPLGCEGAHDLVKCLFRILLLQVLTTLLVDRVDELSYGELLSF